MSILADIRREYPEFRDMSDRELSETLRKKYYSKMPKDQFREQISTSVSFPSAINIPPPPPITPVAAPAPVAVAQKKAAVAPEEEGVFSALGRAVERNVPRFRQGLAQIIEDYPEIVASLYASTQFGSPITRQVTEGLGKAAAKSETYKGLTGETVASERAAAEKKLAEIGPRKYGGFFEEKGFGRSLGSLAETVAESALPVGAGVATGLLTRSPTVAGVVMTGGSLPTTYGGIRETQKAEGIDDVGRAVAGTAVSSALDLLTGVGGKVLSGTAAIAAREILETGLKQAVVRVAKSGVEEAGTEMLQNVIEQVAGGTNPATKKAMLETLEAGLAGALGGTVFTGATEAVTAPFRPKTDKTKVDPEAVNAEFQRLAAEEAANIMAANPGMKQNEAVKFVEENAEALFNRATANLVSGTRGAIDVPDVDTGMDVGAGSGAGAATDIGTTPPVSGVADVGKTVGGGLKRSVSSVPVSDVGAGAGVDTLIEPTAKQVKAMVPTIEQAFEASAIDFVDAYESVLGKNNKLNAEQKKQAARIIIQSPEVDPYDAIGSVLDRGLRLRGEQAPSTSRIAVAPPPAVPAAPSIDEVAVAPVKAAIKSVTDPTGSAIPTLAQTSARQLGIAPAPTTPVAAPTTPAPTTPVAAPTAQAAPVRDDTISGAVYSAQNNERNPLTYEDLIDQLDFLGDMAVRGKLTPERLASSDFGQVQDIGTLTGLKDRIAADPVGTIQRLRESAELNNQRDMAEAAPDVAVQKTVQEAPNAEALVANLIERIQAGEISPEDAGPEVRAFLLADTLNPAKYTPQEVVDNLSMFGGQEARNRGYEDNSPQGSLFREGVRDSNRDIEPLTDEQILANNGPEVLAAYKEGLQWGKDTVAAAQAAPASNAVPTTAGTKPSTARGPSKVKATGTKGTKGKAVKKVISRKPGKTAAEKVLNLAQAEFDQTPKEDVVEQVTPYDPEYESIRAKPGMNATRMAKMLGPQLYGDPTNMGQVCIKEVLQNSFDATRSAVDNGQIEQGEIEISISKNYRTLTVRDNGIGMTPELLGGKFLEIAGTDKEGDKNAGGFGIAKMLFLYANENIRVVTARDGRIAELNVTGEQLFEALDNPDAAPDIDIREFEPADSAAFPDGHGTVIQLTIPEESGDYKIKELPGWLDGIPSLGRSPLFANINVQFVNENYAYSSDTVETGANFPIQDYTQFVGVKFPWGTAKVYVTKEPTGQKYGENMHILSNGLWQFSTKVSVDPSNQWSDAVPYTFYVDIVPSVKPDQPGYPFNFNRQNFTDDAKRDFGKVKSYIDALYAYKSRSGDATTFGLIQYFDADGKLTAPVDLTPDIPVVDTAFTRIAEGDDITISADGSLLVNGQPMPELTPDELKAGIPSASDLVVNPDLIDTDAVMVHDNADVTIKSTGEKMSIPDFMRRQFGERFDSFMLLNGQTFLKLRDEVARVMGYRSLYNEAIGVSLDPEYRGVSIRLPFSGSFINPLVPQYADGLRAGYGIFGTMIHELAHHKVRSHNASFPAEMQNILLNMEADVGFAYQQFKDNFADTIAADYADIVKLGVELFNGQNPDISIEYRGNKFTDGSGEQVSEGTGDSGTGDVRGPSGEGDTGESLLGPAYERRGRAGERGDLGAGDGGGTEPLTDANVEKAVSVKLTKAQIKRLEAAAGIRGREVNNLQKRIIQSRNENETKGLIKRLAGAMRNPDANSGIIASLTQSMPVGGYRLILGFQQIEDIFRLAKLAGMKSIGKIDAMMREEYIPYVNRIVRRASDLEQQWTAFAARNPEGNTALDDNIMYSNMVDADPSLAATSTDYMRIDPKLKELKASLATEIDANKRGSLKRQITIRENAIKNLYLGGTLKDDKGNPILDEDNNPVVVIGWNKLPPEGRKIFKAARDFHRANFNEHYRLLMQRIDDAKFDSNDAVKLKSSIEQMFNKARERTIYFPVKRFGEYWLSVGNDFYMRETPAELKALQRRLKKEGETRPMVTGTSRADLRNKVASNDASAALKGILDALDGGNTAKSNGKPRLERDDMEGLRDLVFQMYLTALPEADMRRRFVHRRFVTGFSTDALRTFAATAVASANQLGRLAYNYKFQSIIEEAKAESESDELTPYRDALRLEIEDRVKSAVAPDSNSILLNAINKMIAFGSKLTFYHHLSSAASAAINLTQLHTLGLPVLSGEFGEAKTAAMAARYTTSLLAGREIPNPFRDEDGNIGLQAPEFKFQNSAYMRSLKKSDPDRYKQTMAAWEYAQDHDVIESTFASSSQLYERSNTPTGDFNFRQAVRRGEVLTAGQRAAANAMSAMGFLFHSTETIGRSVMYMSSFDLAYERAIGKGKTPEQAGVEARKLATDLTNKAMFDFTNWNKSRFAQAPATRFALQMTSYIHSLSSLMLRSFVGMLPYFNKEGKAAAARVFFGSSGVTALYGGAQATLFSPLIMGAYTIAKYVESLLEDDDEEEEIKQDYLNEKTIEREMLKFADENKNELGKKDMDYYIRATFIPETFGKGSTLANALGLSDKAAANLATAADSGIPALFGVDISNSVAMGDLPFIWSNVQVKGDTPEVRAYEGAARMALGPFGSVGISYVKAADAWNNGDIQQAVELAVPAIIRNPLKALRLQEEGLKIGKDKDIQLKDPSYYTGGKTLLQSLGFKDTETTRNMELDLMAGAVERDVAAQKTELLDQRYRAILAFEKNPSKENETKWNAVERDMDIYNLVYPSNAITKDTKSKSLDAKRRDAVDKAYGLSVNKDIPIREATQEERLEQFLRDSGQ